MRRGLFATTGCAVVLAFGLSACGGGGGSSAAPKPIPAPLAPTPTPTPAPAPAPAPALTPVQNIDTAEYRASNSVTSSQAVAAYQFGATGKGIKIGVIDSGINPSLGEFAGRIDPASADVAGSRGVSDEDGHGTAVTGVAAAAKNDSGMHGVAFAATIVSLRADEPGSCATTGDNGGCKFQDRDIAAGIDAARLAGARVVNLSLGGEGIGTTALNAMQRAVIAGMVIVISAGNEGEKPEGVNPSVFASTPARSFPGHVIIAGSVGVSDGAGGADLNQLSVFSNKAGSSSANFLAALGYRNRTLDHTGTGYLYSGTSFAAPTITGAVALMAQAFPNLTGTQIVDILFKSADDLGLAGVDAIFGRGRLNIARAFQPIGTTAMADSKVAVDTSDNGDLPPVAGDALGKEPLGAIILDGYSRAFVLDLAKTLRTAEQAEPLARALEGGAKVAAANAGPVAIAMTVAQNRDDPLGFRLHRLGIGPEDARASRLIAGSAISRLDRKTAVAFGFGQSAKTIERQLSGAEAGAFLIAKDIAGDPGFSARRDASLALRRDLGPAAVTLSGEAGDVWQRAKTSATGSPYRLTSLSLDRSFGRTWLSAGVSRLFEKQTLLGGRMGAALGGGGSDSLFLDLEARRELGNGWNLGLNARRGWTSFAAGQFETGAFGADLNKTGVFASSDRIGLRFAQPLRVENGGFSLLLPTAYDYATGIATSSLAGYSLKPSGRELDSELSYSSRFGRAWLGGNLFIRKDPGHIAAAEDDYGAAIRFTLGF